MTDNVTTPIASSTKFKTKDTGADGHMPAHVLYDEAEAEVLGRVTASPAANTVLGRLKDLLSLTVLAAGTNIIGKVGIDQTTPGTTNGVVINADPLAQGSTTSGQRGSLVMGATTTSAPTYTTGQTSPLSLDTTGALRVNVVTGGGGGGGGAVTVADGADVTLGTKADAANTATDTTAITAMSVWKQISASIQAIAGAVSSSKVATKAASGDFVDGAIATLGTKADAKSTATDTTAITVMQVIKQISASIQGTLTVAAHAVTNAGTFAVQAAHETSSVSNAGTGLTPKFAKVSLSASGTVVAAVTGKKIRVLAWDVVVNAAVNFKWQSHATPTDLTGLYYMAGQGNGVARSFNPLGYFETVAGEALDLNLSGSIAVGGSIVYIEV